jgi:hypothetical protein
MCFVLALNLAQLLLLPSFQLRFTFASHHSYVPNGNTIHFLYGEKVSVGGLLFVGFDMLTSSFFLLWTYAD